MREEKERMAAEEVRDVKRVANAKRAEVERAFTRVQLEALREQFNEADTDNSQSIDANELMVVCQQLVSKSSEGAAREWSTVVIVIVIFIS